MTTLEKSNEISFINNERGFEVTPKVWTKNFWGHFNSYRTIDENYALGIMHNISASYENKKEGELENSPSKVNLCG
jgi:hypothetical protein